MNVAQLKQKVAVILRRVSLTFPRSNERGSIEAAPLPRKFPKLEGFPRSNERGSIEAL